MKIKSKTKVLLIDFSKTMTNFPTIRIDGAYTQRVSEAKIVGIIITSNLHIDEITRRAGKRLFLLPQFKRSAIPIEDLIFVGAPAYTGIHMSSMVDLTHFGSSK